MTPLHRVLVMGSLNVGFELFLALGLLFLTGCASIGNTDSSDGRLLMIPSLTSAGNADIDAALAKWQTIGHFSSLIDCNSWNTNYGHVRDYSGISRMLTLYYLIAILIQDRPVNLLNLRAR
jgi:hypothetical protein